MNAAASKIVKMSSCHVHRILLEGMRRQRSLHGRFEIFSFWWEAYLAGRMCGEVCAKVGKKRNLRVSTAKWRLGANQFNSLSLVLAPCQRTNQGDRIPPPPSVFVAPSPALQRVMWYRNRNRH